MLTKNWRKSTFSEPTSCVEARLTDGGEFAVEVRNSIHPEKGSVFFTTNEWAAFVAGVKNLEFEVC